MKTETFGRSFSFSTCASNSTPKRRSNQSESATFRLSELLAGEQSLTAYCEHGTLGFNRCGHSDDANIPALIEAHGDLTLDELRNRLRCVKCGNRNVSFIVAPKRTGGMNARQW